VENFVPRLEGMKLILEEWEHPGTDVMIFVNIFAKNGGKTGVFDSKQS
jgi:hypothetical protein